MDAAKIVPSPRYVRALGGSIGKGALKAVSLPKGASKRLSAALERTFRGLLGPGAEIGTGAPKLSFDLRAGGEGAPARPRAPEREQGYALEITPDGVAAAAADEAGLFYAAETLRSIARDADAIDCARVVDWPSGRLRGLHLDLKGLRPC